MAQNKVAAEAHGHGGGHDNGHAGHHIVPMSTYVKVLIALLVLTALTVAVARPVSGFDAGIFNTLIAFLIAGVKASLVLAIFMGLKYDKKLNLAIFFTGVFVLLVMLLFCLLDIYTRVHVQSTL